MEAASSRVVTLLSVQWQCDNWWRWSCLNYRRELDQSNFESFALWPQDWTSWCRARQQRLETSWLKDWKASWWVSGTRRMRPPSGWNSCQWNRTRGSLHREKTAMRGAWLLRWRSPRLYFNVALGARRGGWRLPSHPLSSTTVTTCSQNRKPKVRSGNPLPRWGVQVPDVQRTRERSLQTRLEAS